jgi:hypothetical protein
MFGTDLVCLKQACYVSNGPDMFETGLVCLARTWYVRNGPGMFGTDLVCSERTWNIRNGPGMFEKDVVCLERTWYVRTLSEGRPSGYPSRSCPYSCTEDPYCYNSLHYLLQFLTDNKSSHC